jgi:WD40 repeat protein
MFGHNSIVNCVVFSPNDKYIASGNNKSTIKIWKFEENIELYSLRPSESNFVSKGKQTFYRIKSLAFNASGRYLAGSFANKIRIWDMD